MKHREENGPYKGPARFAVLVSIWIVLSLAANAFYVYYQWNRQSDIMASEATILASSLGALIHPEHIADLNSTADADMQSGNLLEKSSLTRLTSAQNDIVNAFLLAAQGQQFIYLADAHERSDAVAATPGTPYLGATDAFFKALADGTAAFIPRIQDAHGTWVRVLVPVRDAVTGAPVALFGIDFDANLWNKRLFTRMGPEFAVSLCLILLSAALVWVYAALMRLRARTEQTATQEAILHSVFEQAPIGIALSSRTRVVRNEHVDGHHMNQKFAALLGRSMEELEALEWKDIPMPDVKLPSQFRRFLAGETESYIGEKTCILPDGRRVRLNLKILPLTYPGFNGAYLALAEDVTQQRAAEEALRESERSKSLLLSHLPGMAYRCRYDRDWTMEFASAGCVALTGYQPDELVENRVTSFNALISPAYREPVWNQWKEVSTRDGNFRSEYEIVKKSGELRWVYEVGTMVRSDTGEILALEGIIIDITERKEREREIAYLSEHDQLTGLFDRRYMLEAAAQLDATGVFPVSAAVCDINGVRMINVAFGNDEGDRLIADVAKIITACTRKGDLVARTGGDEFTLILPGADLAEAGRIAKKIEEAIEAYNRAGNRHPYEVNISVGYDAKAERNVPLEQVIKTAGEYLIHAKLLNHKSSHSALLSSIMATLYARNQETEEHGQRLARYALMIGGALGLSPKALDELQLLSMLHDIGKIGIDDRVLNKPAPLTDEEREDMKKHCEIGHRIALSSPELEHIADYILHHHEKWDGTGYPAGLAGERIPLPARILAVCDAYDAMTENRVYRRAMPMEDALREIERCAGTQFDPVIAALFIRLMKEEEREDTGAHPQTPPEG